MIFKLRKTTIGDIKIAKKFALFPKRINRDIIIWLENYYAKYEYKWDYEWDINRWIKIGRWIESKEKSI